MASDEPIDPLPPALFNQQQFGGPEGHQTEGQGHQSEVQNSVPNQQFGGPESHQMEGQGHQSEVQNSVPNQPVENVIGLADVVFRVEKYMFAVTRKKSLKKFLKEKEVAEDLDVDNEGLTKRKKDELSELPERIEELEAEAKRAMKLLVSRMVKKPKKPFFSDNKREIDSLATMHTVYFMRLWLEDEVTKPWFMHHGLFQSISVYFVHHGFKAFFIKQGFVTSFSMK